MQIKVTCSKVLLPGLSSSKCMPEKLDIFSQHKVAFYSGTVYSYLTLLQKATQFKRNVAQSSLVLPFNKYKAHSAVCTSLDSLARKTITQCIPEFMSRKGNSISNTTLAIINVKAKVIFITFRPFKPINKLSACAYAQWVAKIQPTKAKHNTSAVK